MKKWKMFNQLKIDISNIDSGWSYIIDPQYYNASDGFSISGTTGRIIVVFIAIMISLAFIPQIFNQIAGRCGT